MKFLLLLLPLLAFAEPTEYSLYSNYYLENFRSHFINPGRLTETPDMIYVLSEGEAGFKSSDLLLAVDRENLYGGYQLTEEFGIEGFISPFNGEGIDSWGAKFGVNLAGSSAFYLGFTDSDETDFTPITGFELGAYDGILFGEYEGQFVSVENYRFLIGWAKVYENIFGDLTYSQFNSDIKALDLTVGGRAPLVEGKLNGTAAVTKELFWSKDLNAKIGLEFKPNDKLEFDIAGAFLALDNDDPKYADFNLEAGIKYNF